MRGLWRCARWDWLRGLGTGAAVNFQAPLFLSACAGAARLDALRFARRRRRGTRCASRRGDARGVVRPRRPGGGGSRPGCSLALAGARLALARPEPTVAVPVEQASVVLVTDTSGSMNATDVAPTRLTRRRPPRGGSSTSARRAAGRSRRPTPTRRARPAPDRGPRRRTPSARAPAPPTAAPRRATRWTARWARSATRGRRARRRRSCCCPTARRRPAATPPRSRAPPRRPSADLHRGARHARRRRGRRAGDLVPPDPEALRRGRASSREARPSPPRTRTRSTRSTSGSARRSARTRRSARSARASPPPGAAARWRRARRSLRWRGRLPSRWARRGVAARRERSAAPSAPRSRPLRPRERRALTGVRGRRRSSSRALQRNATWGGLSAACGAQSAPRARRTWGALTVA